MKEMSKSNPCHLLEEREEHRAEKKIWKFNSEACVLWCLGFGTLVLRLGLTHQKMPKSLLGVGIFTQVGCQDYPNDIFREDRFFSPQT